MQMIEETVREIVLNSSTPWQLFMIYTLDCMPKYRRRYLWVKNEISSFAFALTCVFASRSGSASAAFLIHSNNPKWLRTDLVVPLQLLVLWLLEFSVVSNVLSIKFIKLLIGFITAIYHSYSVITSTFLGMTLSPGFTTPLLISSITSSSSPWLTDFILSVFFSNRVQPHCWPPNRKVILAFISSFTFILLRHVFNGTFLIPSLSVVLIYIGDFILFELLE